MDATTTRPVLSFIRAYTADRGYPPSLREMAAALSLTQGVVLRLLRRAERDGDLLPRNPRSSRTWRLTERGEREAGRG